MGIKLSTGAGAVFYQMNGRDGSISCGSGADKVVYEAGRAAIEGTLISMSVKKDEYDGQFRETCKIVLRDNEQGQPNQHVSFTVATGGDANTDGDATGFGLRLLGRLNACDLGQPIELRPWHAKAGDRIGDITFESDYSACSVKQNGERVNESYPDGTTALPELPKVMVGNKAHFDKSPWNAVLDATLGRLSDKLNAATQTHGHQESHAAANEGGVDLEEAAAAAMAAQASAQQGAQADPARAAMRARAAA